MIVRKRLFLTHALAGATVTLAGVSFREGEATITGPDRDVESLAKYLRRSYQALPLEEIPDGGLPDHLYQRAHGQGAVPNGPGAGSDQAADDSAANDPADPPLVGSGEQADPGSGPAAPLTPEAGDPSLRLQAAIQKLDPTNDDHWTALGKPRMDALEQFLGSTDITRADVEKAAPGYDRTVAAQRAA